MAVKRKVCPVSFQKTSLLEKLVHALENINVICPWEDWSNDSANSTTTCVGDHKSKMKAVKLELYMTSAVNLFWHFVMLFPIFWTGNKIPISNKVQYQSVVPKSSPSCRGQALIIFLKPEFDFSGHWISERHNNLLDSIGVYPEEEASYNVAFHLRIWVPLGLLLFSGLELFFFLLSNSSCHPFAKILSNGNSNF